jgi:hypothetical protein
MFTKKERERKELISTEKRKKMAGRTNRREISQRKGEQICE